MICVGAEGGRAGASGTDARVLSTRVCRHVWRPLQGTGIFVRGNALPCCKKVVPVSGNSQMKKARPEVTQVSATKQGARVDHYRASPVCCQAFLGGIERKTRAAFPLEEEKVLLLYSRTGACVLLRQHSEESCP